MNDQTLSHKRLRLLGAFLLVMLAIFVARLFYLQIIRHDHYVERAQAEQVKSLTIPAERGEIYAMDGSAPVKLVLNQAVFTAFVDPMIVNEPDEIVREVREVAGGTTVKNIDELVRDKPSRYQIVARELTRKQAEMLRGKKLSGLGFQQTTQRVYPEGKLAAQVLGFVSADGKGQYGVEGGFDDRLQGTDGMLRSVTDVSNVPLTIGKENTRIPAKNGDDVVLTINPSVQSYTETALKKGMDKIGATNGSVLVMEPRTGKVLAMANYPTFDPANYGKVKNAAHFNNATISEPYEPASVIKTFIMATGVDKGVITPQSTYVNTDSIKVYDRTIRNAQLGVTGTRTMQEVLNNSLNTGTVTVAQRLGDGANVNRAARDTMYEYYYNRFGLGHLTGVELANEAPGLVVSPKEAEGNAVRYSNMTFGQGLNVTMVQVAAGFSSVINGGQYYQPTVIAGMLEDGEVKAKATKPVRRTVSAATSSTMRDMLVTARGSVSYMRDGDRKGFMIGGKTGTAETLKNGRYVMNQSVGTYLGFGGAKRPEYVIMVQVSAPGRNFEGGLHASPIFTDISNWMITHKNLQPR